MPDYSGSYNYLNTLQSIVREGFVTKAIVDTFFTSQRFFQEIRDLVDTQNGALALTWPINVGKSSNTIAFTGGQALPANSLDTFIRASLKWAYYADALALNMTDLQQADSPEAIASLVDAQLDIVKMSIADRLATDFISSTQATFPLQLNGLFEAIDDSTVAPVYAGISRGTYPTFKAIVNYLMITAGTTPTPLDSAAIRRGFAVLDRWAPSELLRDDAPCVCDAAKLAHGDRSVQPARYAAYRWRLRRYL